MDAAWPVYTGLRRSPSADAPACCSEGGESGVYVDGLSEHVVKSPSEISDLLRLGSTMRTTAATNMNRESSRSHAVFSVIVEHSVTNQKGETTVRPRGKRCRDDALATLGALGSCISLT